MKATKWGKDPQSCCSGVNLIRNQRWLNMSTLEHLFRITKQHKKKQRKRNTEKWGSEKTAPHRVTRLRRHKKPGKTSTPDGKKTDLVTLQSKRDSCSTSQILTDCDVWSKDLWARWGVTSWRTYDCNSELSVMNINCF